MSNRVIVRCSVYDGEKVMDVVEQAIPQGQLKSALRRIHFNWRFMEAMETGKRVIFESRKEKP